MIPKLKYTSLKALPFLTVLIMTGLLSCKSNEPFIDKTAMLIGVWNLAETTDPAGMPEEKKVTFFEDSQLSISILTERGARVNSVGSGTWEWAESAQKKILMKTIVQLVYSVDELTETTLILTNDGITETFNKE